MITALVVRRDGLTVLHHGAIGREIPWVELRGIKKSEDKDQGDAVGDPGPQRQSSPDPPGL